jgi:hypothetical protein
MRWPIGCRVSCRRPNPGFLPRFQRARAGPTWSVNASPQEAAHIPLGHESVSDVIRAFSRFGLHSTACEVEQIRLLVFGRKNRNSSTRSTRCSRSARHGGRGGAEDVLRRRRRTVIAHAPVRWATGVCERRRGRLRCLHSRRFAGNGRSAPLTKSGFAVINGGSSTGHVLVSQFEETWASARPGP